MSKVAAADVHGAGVASRAGLNVFGGNKMKAGAQNSARRVSIALGAENSEVKNLREGFNKNLHSLNISPTLRSGFHNNKDEEDEDELEAELNKLDREEMRRLPKFSPRQSNQHDTPPYKVPAQGGGRGSKVVLFNVDNGP
jgi:hypothetical protein